jgi:hypothetical protein
MGWRIRSGAVAQRRDNSESVPNVVLLIPGQPPVPDDWLLEALLTFDAAEDH